MHLRMRLRFTVVQLPATWSELETRIEIETIALFLSPPAWVGSRRGQGSIVERVNPEGHGENRIEIERIALVVAPPAGRQGHATGRVKSDYLKMGKSNSSHELLDGFVPVDKC